MGRGGKVGSKPCGKRRIRSKDNGSDESDEDYTVGGDEEFNDSEDYTSFTGEESEESFGEFEEEEDEVEEKVRKASRSKGRKAFMGRKKNGVGKARKKRKVSYKVEDDEDFEDEDEDEDFEVKSGVGKARKKRKVSYKVEDDEDFEDEGDDEDFKEKNGVGKARYKRKVSYKVEDDEDFEVEDDEDFEEKNGIGKARSKRKVSYKVEDDEDFKDEGDDEDFEEKNGIGKARNKRKVSYKVEDDDDFKDEGEGDDEDFEDEGDDEDFEDEGVDDEDDDDEFAPDEIDLYDEDELAVGKKKKKKVRRPFLENGRVKGRKRKRNSKVIKKPMRKKLTKSRGLRRNSVAGNDGAFTEKKPVVKERNKKNSGQRNRRIMTDSDPDFVSSGLSDFDYTISEEEREQVREASKFCRDLTTALRSSFLTKRSQEGVLFHHQRKRSGRKGKGKVEDLKNEAVCGICFSEEGKKTVRGTLNCCSHYFCFTCIMEWSKVESRCPLCKQRFASISKPAKSNTGFDLRTVVIQVPERDQVYQPSEEELRGYLDPYENVICTECQQGGDDALMLLCDLCDSPAHTFCVGLGREVPEGSWYCEGCRPTAFASSNPQAPNPMPDHRTINNFSGRSSPVENVREAIDLNSAYVPETPLNHGTGIFSSPRHPVGDFQAASPVSGTGVLTVSVRRRIQRQIHDMLSNRSQSGSRIVGMSASTSGNNLLGSQIEQGREVAFQHAITPERSSSHQPFSQGRFQGNFMPSVQSTRDLSSARLSHSRGQPIQGQSSTSGADGSANRMLQAGFAGISRGMNSRLGYEQQLHPCGSRSSIADDSMSPYRYREVSHFNVEKEQVQSMVRSHLKSLSREMELGYSTTFKDIARISTHTILASCGIEHQVSEVYPVQPPSMCNHAEAMAGGQTSLMKGFCTSCFDSFVRRVVREITNTQSASSIV